ncbi:MAG: alpha/beta hydrolase [Niameybacter sp.]|uniref:alpha/beta hydrolase n=1 Tax=Niameybacter sp. TaxID=2033640 RepID=UPI002FC70930
MISEKFTFIGGEELIIQAYKWIPEHTKCNKGVVQISHGMAEGAHRYTHLAQYLTDNGYIVYAHDHRGHGKTAVNLDKLGILAKEDGFQHLVLDVHRLSKRIQLEYPELPLFLLGHSMGSFVTQEYIMHYGECLRGVLLSGSNGKQGPIVDLGLWIAGREVRKIGRDTKSVKLDKLIFGKYNKQFEPARTHFDWLSRDEEEVDKYLADPYCGRIFTAGFFYDFLSGIKYVGSLKNKKTIPEDLPIFVFSGDKDPVGRYGKGILDLVEDYKKVGIRQVTYKLYPGGRHEMLNETNRDEVMQDILEWIEKLI